MAEAASNTSQQTGNKVVDQAVRRFDESWGYAKQNHHKRWSRNLKLYNNKRVAASYKGISNTFVPMAFSITETLTAALGAGRPSIDFMPQDMYKYIESYYNTGKKPDLKALNAQFDYYWDCDNWDLKSIKTIRAGFRDGTACEWVYWDSDKPRIINLHARDAIIDPRLRDPMQLITNPDDFYTGRRYLTTKEALKAEKVVDPETGELKPRFKKLHMVQPGNNQGDQLTKEEKEMQLGSVLSTDDQVEVLEIWTGKRIVSIANRSIDIEDRGNPIGMHSLVIHRFIADEDIIHGRSIIDVIAQQQELLNDVTNQRVDAVTDILNPQYELDPAYSDHLPKITNAPGTVYPFRAGSLNRIEKGTVTPQAFNETQNMKNEIREATGADQVVQGVQADSKTTATEINAQLSQAGQRFELYVRMLEKEAFYQRAKIVYRMMKVYSNEMTLVPTNTMDGPKFRVFDPTQYDDTYEPKIQLEASVKNTKSRMEQEAMNAYQMLIADPTNDLWEVKKVMYPKLLDLSEEELDRIIGPEKPQEPMQDPSMEDPAAMSGEVPMPDMPMEAMA